MELLLPFHVTPSTNKIAYTDKVFFIGSCFSEKIAGKMKGLKFNVLQNPNGILYDPLSISAALVSYIENRQFAESDLFSLDGLWHSWQHHSAFSGMDKEPVWININQARAEAYRFLATASWLIITPGTSYNYSLKKTGEPVANCHKAPQELFEKKLLPVEEIIRHLSNALLKAKALNPQLSIIFTISPVRHTRDGVVENNRSKARLIEAVHYLKENIEGIFYFPAYELVIDVLRDYRFYKSDLVHPSGTAIEFVFETFCKTFIDEQGKKLLQEIEVMASAMNHKPFQKESAAHKKFMQAQLQKVEKIKSRFPLLDFSIEEKYFSGF
ncbi:MAG: GSCFA domain-containing protein [Ginsengibacter sp.]